MYLIDTNIWLERILDQKRALEVGQFLDRVASEKLYITDFALHSIGIVLSKLKRLDIFLRFIQDAFMNGAVSLVHLEPEDMRQVADVESEFKLDFDDAYQYVSAEKNELTIVSFDSDFDRTKLGRKTPAEL